MKKILAVVALLAALISLGIWWFSPEQVIMRRTEKLVELFSLSEKSSSPKQMRVYAMNKMLCPTVELIIPEVSEANGSFDKAEIEAAFSWICQNATKSQFEIISFRNVDVDQSKASVSFATKGFIQLQTVCALEGNFEVTIVWKKGADGWIYEKVICKKL